MKKIKSQIVDSPDPEQPYREYHGDDAAVRELELYIENDSDLYHQRTIPIMKNLLRKMKKNTFDFNKSITLWEYLVMDGAKKYIQEFSPGARVQDIFPKNVRREVAKNLAEYFVTEAELGNYDNLLEKGAKMEKKSFKLDAATFNGLLSNKYTDWAVSEAEIRAANSYGAFGSVEEANANIDKAIDEIANELKEGVHGEVKRIVDEKRDDILESLSEGFTHGPNLQKMGPDVVEKEVSETVERPEKPIVPGASKHLSKVISALENSNKKKAKMTAALRRKFDASCGKDHDKDACEEEDRYGEKSDRMRELKKKLKYKDKTEEEAMRDYAKHIQPYINPRNPMKGKKKKAQEQNYAFISVDINGNVASLRMESGLTASEPARNHGGDINGAVEALKELARANGADHVEVRDDSGKVKTAQEADLDKSSIVFQKLGPGKFNNTVDEYLYEIIMNGFSNETLGDEAFGTYDLILFDTPLQVEGGESIGGAIIWETDQGFVESRTFTSADKAQQLWNDLEAEYAEFLEEYGEPEPDFE